MTEPVEPHTYYASAMHMGDCMVCGHEQDSVLHVGSPKYLAAHAVVKTDRDYANLHAKDGAPLFRVGQRVSKFAGDYGGVGTVRAMFEALPGSWRYVVEFRIQNGHGVFFHILTEKQLAAFPGKPEVLPHSAEDEITQ